MLNILFENILVPVMVALAIFLFLPTERPIEELELNKLFKRVMLCIVILIVGWTTYNSHEISSDQYDELKNVYDPEIVEMTKKALQDDNKISNGEMYLIKMKLLYVMYRNESASEENLKKNYKEDLINR